MEENKLDELDKTMLCAKWIVTQFEKNGYSSISRIFQIAVNDAEAWIHAMVTEGKISKDSFEPIKAEEVKLLHNILVRYASISNPDHRNKVLESMKENAGFLDECSNL